MAKELKRLCLRCEGKLREGGIGCKLVEKAGGSTGTCSGCGERRLCFTWEIEYQGRGDTSSAPAGHLPLDGKA